tara:strand:- start:924 stop:1199 length:276 start_codon:yes stop_codon:yes gene_type:complete
MFILSVRGKSKEEGAYAVEDEDGQKVLFLFEEEDDAVRYAMMMSMSDEEYPALDVTEVPDEVAINACEAYDYPYVVISSDDLLIPKNYDKI